jgi:transposase
MSYEIHADYGQQFLLPPSLEDWVPPDHPVRFIRDFVAQLDLVGLGFRVRQSPDGRPSYSSELLLSAWLYGYMEKIRSSRKLEHAGRTHLPLIWLLGMNYPDHNSLWRFWSAHRLAIRGVFRQSVLVAQKLGLVGMVVHALDGTKVAVQASPKGALHRSSLETLLASVDQAIAALEAEVEAEGPTKAASMALPEQLQEAIRRRAAIGQALAELDEQGQNHALPAEPDARMMKQSGGGIGWAYNAQAVVDDAHGIIVAQDVTNEPVDYRQLTPMLEQVRQTTGGVAKATVADAGYRSTKQEIQAKRDGHTVVLPEHGRQADRGDPYHKSRFTYDATTDSYTCPQGQPLHYTRTLPPHGSRSPARVYQCRSCDDCPVRAECTRDHRGRTIRRDEHEEYRQEQRAQRAQPQIQKLLRRRKAIIEPLFGHIKHNQDFRRWSARGLLNARAQWSMLCVTVNLKTLWKAWRTGGPCGPAPAECVLNALALRFA